MQAKLGYVLLAGHDSLKAAHFPQVPPFPSVPWKPGCTGPLGPSSPVSTTPLGRKHASPSMQAPTGPSVSAPVLGSWNLSASNQLLDWPDVPFRQPAVLWAEHRTVSVLNAAVRPILSVSLTCPSLITSHRNCP